MEAKHTVYVLSSSSEPNLYRYVGCTTNVVARLANHARQVTRTGMWAYWERVHGDDVVMRQVASFQTKRDGREAEMMWIQSLAGWHLLNEESWSVWQSNAGVPRALQYLYQQLLRHGTIKAKRGEYNDASDFIYMSKTLASVYSGLSIVRVGGVLKRDLAICNRLGPAEALPIIGSLPALQINYQGHSPHALCMRL
jgi:predicted GIY-YIG superfamily endonuclease